MQKNKIILTSLLLGIGLVLNSQTPTWTIRVAKHLATIGKRVKTLEKFSKIKYALPQKEINKLAKISIKKDGLKEVGKILGKMNLPGKYGDEIGQLILQDTYLRIAVKNGRISEKVAQKTFSQLGGTPGLTTLLRKINSSSLSQSKGHLRELEIALSCKEKGFSTVSLSENFSDIFKKGDTDLDVLLKRGNKKFAIESKAYSHEVPNSMVIADAESIAYFCKEIDNCLPIFCFENYPSKFAQKYLALKKIKCVVGTPDEIAAKLSVISSIK